MKSLVYIFIFCSFFSIAQSNDTVATYNDNTNGSKYLLSGQIYSVVEESPEYPGGYENFKKDIDKFLVYTEEMKKNKKKCFVNFIINKDGFIGDVLISKGSECAECDENLLTAILKTKKFKPGKQGGKNVDVQMLYPYSYSK